LTIDKGQVYLAPSLASPKPPFRATPASGFAGTGVQIDPETGPKRTF
jgi:hypothetical protein